MKYRKLTREEAKQLFELGAAIESRHLYYLKDERSSDDVGWGACSEHCLKKDSKFKDYFRIAIE